MRGYVETCADVPSGCPDEMHREEHKARHQGKNGY